MSKNVVSELAVNFEFFVDILRSGQWSGNIYDLAINFTGTVASEKRSEGVFAPKSPLGRATDLDIWREFFARLQDSYDRVNKS